MTEENLFDIVNGVALRDVAILPGEIMSIVAGRKKSIDSIKIAQMNAAQILVVAQKRPDTEDPDINDIYKIGTMCDILHVLHLPNNVVKLIIKGTDRAKILDKISDKNKDINLYNIEKLIYNNNKKSKSHVEAAVMALVKNFRKYLEITDQSQNQTSIGFTIDELNKNPFDHIPYIIASVLGVSAEERQAILEDNNLYSVVKTVYKNVERRIQLFNMEQKMSKDMQERINKNQKEFYLNEQLKQIQKELGKDGDTDELGELGEKIKKAKLPKEASEKVNSEFRKLKKMSPYAADASVVRNYIEYLIELPWETHTRDTDDINKVEEILNKSHYGLVKAKERIIEFAAVMKRRNEILGKKLNKKLPKNNKKKTDNHELNKSPIICLVGPPGVGKTSLAEAIAKSLNKNFAKIALGGLRDEAEIRGHRRTYIGAQPGKIVQSVYKTKSMNPLVLLDEIDKLSYDYRGDPSSALLEVLDPEQNIRFNDHYLEVDFDLSEVFFVATANNIQNIPVPLKDRMEVIKISGYSEEEKLHIAKNHLIPKQMRRNGLKEKELKISDEVILELIRKYTFEAGVRNLEREIANLARKAVKEVISSKVKSSEINLTNLEKYSGPYKFSFGLAQKENPVGISTGLAYTEYGGDILSIEVLKFAGDGKVKITGKLGEVMQESVQTALSHIKYRLIEEKLIDSKEFGKFDFHIHVPEGATPKDGPSAGIAICTALFSVITSAKIDRTIAMTGEVTLSGLVLPIGGLKEKLLAALRGGIKTVLIPEENKKDLIDLPKSLVDNLVIIPVAKVEEVLKNVIIGYDKLSKIAVSEKSAKVKKKNES